MLVSFSRERLCKLLDSIKRTLQLRFIDRLAAEPAMEIELRAGELAAGDLRIPEIPPLTACYFEVRTTDR